MSQDTINTARITLLLDYLSYSTPNIALRRGEQSTRGNRRNSNVDLGMNEYDETNLPKEQVGIYLCTYMDVLFLYYVISKILSIHGVEFYVSLWSVVICRENIELGSYVCSGLQGVAMEHDHISPGPVYTYAEIIQSQDIWLKELANCCGFEHDTTLCRYKTPPAPRSCQ